jgi:hypothetical protein
MPILEHSLVNPTPHRPLGDGTILGGAGGGSLRLFLQSSTTVVWGPWKWILLGAIITNARNARRIGGGAASMLTAIRQIGVA